MNKLHFFGLHFLKAPDPSRGEIPENLKELENDRHWFNVFQKYGRHRNFSPSGVGGFYAARIPQAFRQLKHPLFFVENNYLKTQKRAFHLQYQHPSGDLENQVEYSSLQVRNRINDCSTMDILPHF